MKKRIICLLCMICLVQLAWCSLPWTGSKTLSGWDWDNRLYIPAGDFISCQVGDMIGVTVSWIPANDAWIDINGLQKRVTSAGVIGILVDEKICNELDLRKISSWAEHRLPILTVESRRQTCRTFRWVTAS